MGSVQFDAVEADALRGGGRVGEGGDDVVQVLPGHRPAGGLVGADAQSGGADGGGVREGRAALLADHADVPELRHDRAARRVHRLGDLRPARQLLLAVEAGHPVAVTGRGVADVRALGDDQADARGGTAGVVRHDVLAGDAARGELPGHRRHDDAVGDGQAVQGDGAGEDPRGAAAGLGRGDGGGGGHRETPRGRGRTGRYVHAHAMRTRGSMRGGRPGIPAGPVTCPAPPPRAAPDTREGGTPRGGECRPLARVPALLQRTDGLGPASDPRWARWVAGPGEDQKSMSPPGMPPGAPAGAAFSGLSAMTASVVRNSAAMEAAF